MEPPGLILSGGAFISREVTDGRLTFSLEMLPDASIMPTPATMAIIQKNTLSRPMDEGTNHYFIKVTTYLPFFAFHWSSFHYGTAVWAMIHGYAAESPEEK